MSRSGRALLGVLALVPPSTVDALDQPVVANTPPSVVITAPIDGGFAQPGEPLPFEVTVADAEDGTVDCTKVVVTFGGQTAAVGPDCAGVLTPEAGQGVRTFSAAYTDNGALTGAAEVTLNPREHLATDYPSGVLPAQPPAVDPAQPPGADPNQPPGTNPDQPPAGSPDQLPGPDPELPVPSQPLLPQPRNWFVVPHSNLAGIHHIAMELAASQPGATLTVHADSPDGPVIATFPGLPEPSTQYQWLAADVADPVGVHDLYFVANGLSARYFRFQTTPAVTATIPPTPTGWHTTDVPITVTTAPLWDPQVSLDAGASWIPAPVILSAEGAYDLRYRAVDAAGRTTEPVATPVRIDRTAPTVAVTREHPHTTTLELAATDIGSGVATLAATLDGAPITGPVDLWRYPSGVHQLTVTTTDVAGNTATQATELEITTSLAELTPMLDKVPMPFVKSVILRLQLMAVERALRAGRTDEAVTWVRAFLRSSSALRDPTARAALTGDAAIVITQLKN